MYDSSVMSARGFTNSKNSASDPVERNSSEVGQPSGHPIFANPQGNQQSHIRAAIATGLCSATRWLHATGYRVSSLHSWATFMAQVRTHLRIPAQNQLRWLRPFWILSEAVPNCCTAAGQARTLCRACKPPCSSLRLQTSPDSQCHVMRSSAGRWSLHELAAPCLEKGRL